MNLAELVVREKVRETIGAYSHAGDRFQLDDLSACFTEDGVLEVRNSFVVQGRRDIIRALTGRAGSRTPDTGRKFFVRHFVTNIRFAAVQVASVETSSYFAVLHPDGVDHWGRYRDVFVEVGDRWLLRRRVVVVDGARVGSSHAELAEPTPPAAETKPTTGADGPAREAPFDTAYRCADGRLVIVSATDAESYSELLDGLGLADIVLPPQLYAEGWRALQDRFASLFRSRDCAYWTTLFASTRASVTREPAIGSVR